MLDPAAKVLNQIDPVVDDNAFWPDYRLTCFELIKEDYDVCEVDEARDTKSSFCQEGA